MAISDGRWSAWGSILSSLGLTRMAMQAAREPRFQCAVRPYEGGRTLSRSGHIIGRGRKRRSSLCVVMTQLKSATSWYQPQPTIWDRIPRPRRWTSLLVIVGVPAVAVIVRGFCWEAFAIALPVVALLLAPLLVERRIWFVAVVGHMVLGLLVLSGWSMSQSGTVDLFTQSPPRLTLCGRFYAQEGAPVARPTQPVATATNRELGVTISGNAILGTGCDTTVLWVQSTATTYQAYDLEGGP
jgi:hypothetical protein